MARILILNCFIKGWNILKSLADDGFEVNGGDYRSGAPGLYSNRIKDKSLNLIYPNPKIEEKAFVGAVLDHVSRHRFDIVLPVNASEMMALARYRGEVEKYSRFPFENYFKLLLLHDKKYFHEIVSAICGGEYLPRSWSIGNKTPSVKEIMQKAGLEAGTRNELPLLQEMDNYSSVDHFLNAQPGIIYPLIVKTRRATSARGIYRAHDSDELELACGKLGGEDIIVQQTIDGRGVGISGIRWDNPSMLHLFGHKRIREYPISGGASTSREPWPADKEPIADKVRDIFNRLSWRGVVMFEFKEIRTDDERFEYRFLEANPRFWGSVPLAIVNGFNFPVLLCRAALDQELPEVKNSAGIRARIFFSDSLSLILNIFKGRRVFYNLREYFRFRNLYHDDIDFGDLPATMRVFAQMLSEFFSRR